MYAVIWFLAIALPVAAILFLLGWLMGFNHGCDELNWGTGFDDGWRAREKYMEEMVKREAMNIDDLKGENEE